MANKKTQPKVVVLPAKAKTKPKPRAARKPTALAIQKQTTPEAMIMQAINQGVSVKTLERLMVIRREVKSEQAKEAFDTAMANFQSECPVIKKTRGVPLKNGLVAYRYSPLDKIVEQTKDLIKKHGFSYMIKTETIFDEKSKTSVKSTCIVKHQLGHSEESDMMVPIGTKTDIMSDSQVVAAAATFSKRYAFINAFGILTGDDDNDGQKEIKEPNKKGKVKAVDVSVEDKFQTALSVINSCKNKKTINRYYKDISSKGPKVYNKEQMSDLMEALIKKGDELK